MNKKLLIFILFVNILYAEKLTLKDTTVVKGKIIGVDKDSTLLIITEYGAKKNSIKRYRKNRPW